MDPDVTVKVTEVVKVAIDCFLTTKAIIITGHGLFNK